MSTHTTVGAHKTKTQQRKFVLLAAMLRAASHHTSPAHVGTNCKKMHMKLLVGPCSHQDQGEPNRPSMLVGVVVVVVVLLLLLLLVVVVVVWRWCWLLLLVLLVLLVLVLLLPLLFLLLLLLLVLVAVAAALPLAPVLLLLLPLLWPVLVPLPSPVLSFINPIMCRKNKHI
jgi:hypothetical protein